jgi:DNA-binding LacI/PurR family transcriptional regulator
VHAFHAAQPADGAGRDEDHRALLAYRAAQLVGLAVPGDVSIVGFDDIDILHQLACRSPQ